MYTIDTSIVCVLTIGYLVRGLSGANQVFEGRELVFLNREELPLLFVRLLGCSNRLFKLPCFVTHAAGFRRAPAEIRGLKNLIWFRAGLRRKRAGLLESRGGAFALRALPWLLKSPFSVPEILVEIAGIQRSVVQILE